MRQKEEVIDEIQVVDESQEDNLSSGNKSKFRERANPSKTGRVTFEQSTRDMDKNVGSAAASNQEHPPEKRSSEP